MPKIKRHQPWHGPDSQTESKLYTLMLAIGIFIVAGVFVQGFRDVFSDDFHLTHGY